MLKLYLELRRSSGKLRELCLNLLKGLKVSPLIHCFKLVFKLKPKFMRLLFLLIPNFNLYFVVRLIRFPVFFLLGIF